MAVFRVEKNSNYTTIGNYHLRDKRLSLKAKGLLTLMLSLPDDWDYSAAGLVAICREGEAAVKSALKELKQCGYLTIEKIPPSDGNGRFEYVYNVYESTDCGKLCAKHPENVDKPVENMCKTPKQEGGFLAVENLGVEILGLENQGQLNTNNKRTEKSNTENKGLGRGAYSPPPPRPCPRCDHRTFYNPQMSAYVCDECSARFGIDGNIT